MRPCVVLSPSPSIKWEFFIAILFWFCFTIIYRLSCEWLNLSLSHRVYDHKEPHLNLVQRNRCHFEILDLEMML